MVARLDIDACDGEDEVGQEYSINDALCGNEGGPCPSEVGESGRANRVGNRPAHCGTRGRLFCRHRVHSRPHRRSRHGPKGLRLGARSDRPRQRHRRRGLNVLRCSSAQVPWITHVIAPWGQAESLLPGGQIDSRNSAPAAVTATLSAMSSTGATSNSSQVENFAGASARLVGLSVSTTA